MTANPSHLLVRERDERPGRLSDQTMDRLRASLIAVRDDETVRLLELASDEPATANDQHSEISAVLSSTTLVDIERALSRLDDGTYGSCESCGGAIALERLEAIPFATTCFSCAAAPSPTPCWRATTRPSTR